MIVIPATTSSYIKHGLLLNLTVEGTDYYIANTYNPITYNGNTYQALGHYLGFDQIQDDLRPTNNALQITLSGIPIDASEAGLPGYSSYIAFILNQKIKGSLVKIYRVFFNTTTNALLSDSTTLRFQGYISNYTITDGIDNKDNTRTVVCNVSSVNGILERRIVGRRTNGTDQKAFFPGDTGMDRVIAISNTSFDFGKPYTGGGTGGGSGSGGSFVDPYSGEGQVAG